MIEPVRVECPNCGCVGQVKDAPVEGAKLRCAKCREWFVYHRPASSETTTPSVFKPIAEPSPIHSDRAIPEMERRLKTLERKWRLLVFAVLAYFAVGPAISLWKFATYSSNSRLNMGEFCQVSDFTTVFKPTLAYLYTANQEIDLLKYSDEPLEPVFIGDGAIARVWVDGEDESPAKMGGGSIDKRMVSIRMISGPYSGRRVRIARYKLERLGNLCED